MEVSGLQAQGSGVAYAVYKSYKMQVLFAIWMPARQAGVWQQTILAVLDKISGIKIAACAGGASVSSYQYGT
jgi:hypothetical protein